MTAIRKKAQAVLFRALDPIFRRFRRKRIVMFHNGRSGSGVMGFMLNDHPDIYWAGELLKGPRVARYKSQMSTFDHRRVIYQDEFHAGLNSYGFEMKYMHIRHLGLSQAQFLADLDALNYTHFIVLVRKNVLRRETSSKVALVTGHYHVNKSNQVQLQQISLNTDTLIHTLDKFTNDEKEMLDLISNRTYLLLYYEDDIQNDPGVAFRKICEHIGVSIPPITPRLQRTNPFPLHEIILNFDDVVATLKGTKYEWMLELEHPRS